MVKAMLGQDSRESYKEIFAEAVHTYPSYTPFYFMKVWHLQTRWYGGPGEWEAFAKESADRVGGEAGDILYAQILWYVHDNRFYGNPLGQTAIEWPRARRGFEAIRHRYPDSVFALNEYCFLSGLAPGDRAPLMRQLFGELGNRVDLKVWKTTEKFVHDRQWSQSH